MKRILALLLSIFLLCGCQPAAQSPEQLQTRPADTQPATNPDPQPSVQPETQPQEPVFDPWAMASGMSDEELVGQLFLVGFSNSTAISEIETYHPAGLVLFGFNLEGQDADSLPQTLQSYQDAANIPLLIAVDEEGGTVTRISSFPAFRASRFPSPRSLYDQGGLDLVLETEEEKCVLLNGLGINVNLAPVCDITTDPDSFMYSRSLGREPEETGAYIAQVVTLQDSYGIGGVLKHFPGYGNNVDTHVGIATDHRSVEELEGRDLVPFAYGIDAGCDAIMVSHTIITCLDDVNPATVSPAVMDYLRSTMGFEGVIVTDDMIMQGLTDVYGTGEAAVLALEAGADLLCCSTYIPQYQAVLEALQSGRLSRQRIEDSVARILNWKYDLGLIAP